MKALSARLMEEYSPTYKAKGEPPWPGGGGVKVEPVWNGGEGTVKLTIIDSDYNKPSPTLIDEVQRTAVDPEQNQGGRATG